MAMFNNQMVYIYIDIPSHIPSLKSGVAGEGPEHSARSQDLELRQGARGKTKVTGRCVQFGRGSWVSYGLIWFNMV